MTQRPSPPPDDAEDPAPWRADARDARDRLVGRVKRWLLRLWMLRGGGFYGLGFVVFFVTLQIRSFIGDIAESTGVIDFLSSQALEALLKVISETPFNFLWALLWPLQFLSWTGEWGLLVLLAAYLSFQRWVKPRLTERFFGKDQNSPVG